ncbi:MAG: BatA domain-containing protein [Bacteroidales bacterium]
MNISFTYPFALLGISFIIIPIIIHLFTFRKYTPIYFHSIFLLKESQKEDTKSRKNLKELLILASRILAILFLALAFAQPYIPTSDSQNMSPTSPVSIYIDNSFSAENETIEGNVLEVAKSKAYHIIEAYPPSHTFYILSNNPAPGMHLPLNKSHAIEKITSLETVPFSEKISSIYHRAQTLTPEQSHTLYLISDFQKHITDIQNMNTDSLLHVSFIPITPEKTNNLSIDSVWFESPYRLSNQTEKIHVRILNTGTETYAQHPVELYISDTLRAVSSFSIPPESSITTTLEYTLSKEGNISGYISLNDYPVLYDNTYFIAYHIQSTHKVLSLYDNSPHPNISQLLSYDSHIKQSEMKSSEIKYGTFSSYDVLILDRLYSIPSGLNKYISQHVHSGKTVIIIPPEECDIDSYNTLISTFTFHSLQDKDTTQQAIEDVDFTHILFRNLFENTTENSIQYPQISSYYPLSPEIQNPLIALQNRQTVLTNISQLPGACYLFTIPFSKNNSQFLTHPLFMSLYNMIQLSKNTNSIQTYIGEPIIIENPGNKSEQPLHITNSKKNIDFIPQTQQHSQENNISLHCFNAVTESGIYTITQNDSTIQHTALNYTRNESNMNFVSAHELTELAQSNDVQNFSLYADETSNITHSIQNKSSGIELWRYALLLSLLFICTEIALIRYWHILFPHKSK